MSQTFPPEIFDLLIDEFGSTIEDPQSRAALLTFTLVNRQFYRQASSYIFSSVSISRRRSGRRLNGLLDIINANPNIAPRIRCFMADIFIYDDCLPSILRQLSRLQKFGWTNALFFDFGTTVFKSIQNLCHLPSLTSLHFENVTNFPLSLFSVCCRLESLTLIRVRFAKIASGSLPGSLLSSLKRLEMADLIKSDDDLEAVRIIMTRAAPTLTALILCTCVRDSIFLNLDSIVFPVLRSVQMSCAIDNNTLPIFIFQFLNYSAPMVNQIQIQVVEKSYPPFAFAPKPCQWLPIDKILSGPRYPALKKFSLSFSEKHPTLSSELAIRTLLNEVLPAVSSCSHWIEIRTEPSSTNSCVEIHFIF